MLFSSQTEEIVSAPVEYAERVVTNEVIDGRPLTIDTSITLRFEPTDTMLKFIMECFPEARRALFMGAEMEDADE